MLHHPSYSRLSGHIGFWLALLALLLVLIALAAPARAERIKDLASIAGVRSNQLIGYGLVVGLDGTGDKTSSSPFTEQSLRSMLNQLGVVVPPTTAINPKNVAAVSLHADMPPFAKPGQRIDVTASSLGDAKSLRGGTLLMSPLKGADGKVYAIAQGNLVVGGLSASGADGSKITVNIPSVGRIPNGATVEREVASAFASGNYLTLNLHDADFTTAQRVVESINETIGPGAAQAVDATSVRVSSPLNPSQRVSFIALIENLEVKPGTAAARIVVNSRTGTVVISSQVRVTPAAVSHGSLTVTISESPQVSQPEALSGGTTQVTPQSGVAVSEGGSRMFLFNPGVTLDEVVRAVNQVGAAPSDLVAILEALKQAGALKAELVVI
ncbi:MAG: flagellar biosynthesis protein FlgI [Candidatus Sedimenticola endophacoides]|uniref:Flagellar P-ring protein n=1 Tax=Candidatus Sedimenticola endophacoides TaxID=2548426 RepID=A0A657PS64_9GAMM|nr:MAG: flagellar biosynthesis protein FlgI [Candidatus Sedimenticola endophacoides]OQX43450.1 MAG: flagellar biosynthesis protein FlgI [Candidatus Sedimenticola endophacoides]PUD99943.1 MAG: flagellar biosynthesis protein FlgI [Candidatus Sedimenticola endophacoides]PUE01858.1 MAG: flagellar biosynthesis protein FlgI [Candidatus Sedimenticola endophacoides]PUE03685.1 MAG: flagellar biosynthesis protein FlgI [Candidatus Sedimenticola endophacoides]